MSAPGPVPPCPSCAARDEVEVLGRRLARERTRRRTAEEHALRLSEGSQRDLLTGLPDRAGLVSALGRSLEAARRGGLGHPGHVGVLLLDLDGFARVDAELGTATGDQVLLAVAQRLREVVAPADVLARVGGDEFAVVVPRPDDAEALRSLADAVAAALREPVAHGEWQVPVGCSTGLRLAEATDGAEQVLREAQAALYVAKHSGRGRTVLFDSEQSEAAARRTFEAELRRGLREGELQAAFQELVDLTTGRVVGAEALVRWFHPERGLIPPLEFIDQADEARLLDLVTDEMLRQACAWAAVHPEVAGPVHVNVSVHDLADPRLLERVTRALDASALPPSRLSLEITERVFLSEDEVAFDNMAALRDLGVGLAIDDFGVQYASFSYLRRLPADEVKIDRCFVTQVESDPRDRAVLAGIVTMARALGMKTVAEGVETAGQARVLADLGVDIAQGWLYGRPRPAASWDQVPALATAVREG